MKKLFVLGVFLIASLSLSAMDKGVALENNFNNDVIATKCYKIVWIGNNPVYVEIECPPIIIIID